MKFFAWLLVLLSAFCAAFARLDNGFNTDRRALLRTSTGNRIVPLTARNLKAVTTQALDDDNDDDDDDDDEDDISESDTEADFASDVDSIDGESDAGCPTGVYTLKYIAKKRFATGKKTKEVKSNNIDACAMQCGKNRKNKKCATFNYNKKSKKCVMFSTKDIGRDKMADTNASAAFLQCVKK